MKNILSSTEYNSHYQQYLDKIPEGLGLLEGYKKSKESVISFFTNIPKEKLTYRYESDKWSIKEVFQHLIDSERIFIHRCFRIARNDQTSLPGFDQDTYVKPSGADLKSLADLMDEFVAVRMYSISLLKSLSEEALKTMGVANGDKLSARAAAAIVLGHEIWHIEIIKERYL